jgi:hypothetical protein
MSLKINNIGPGKKTRNIFKKKKSGWWHNGSAPSNDFHKDDKSSTY